MEISLRSESQLIIHDKPHPMRLVISLPFFIASGYFLYHLILALADYVRNANLSEWIGALPGMAIMLVLATAIVLPGLFLAARESVVVNKSLGLIGKRRELLGLHSRGKIVKLSSVKSIVCRQQTRKHTDRKPGSSSGRTSSVTVYPVDLLLDDEQALQIGEFSEKSDAREMVKAIADFSELSADDRLG